MKEKVVCVRIYLVGNFFPSCFCPILRSKNFFSSIQSETNLVKISLRFGS